MTNKRAIIGLDLFNDNTLQREPEDLLLKQVSRDSHLKERVSKVKEKESQITEESKEGSSDLEGGITRNDAQEIHQIKEKVLETMENHEKSSFGGSFLKGQKMPAKLKRQLSQSFMADKFGQQDDDLSVNMFAE